MAACNWSVQHTPNSPTPPGGIGLQSYQPQEVTFRMGSLSKRSHVISIGDDQHLLATREAVLRSVGLSVLSLSSSLQAEDAALRAGTLLVLCHTLGNTRPFVVETIRAMHPNVPVLLLEPVRFESRIENASVSATHPHLLLGAIDRMLSIAFSLDEVPREN